MAEASPITVILNVGSGHGDAASCEREIRSAFESASRAHRIVVAKSPEQVERQTRLAMAAARKQPQIIVAAGGDGTVNLVARLVLERDLPFGVIPLGTFNYFARDLGIPLDPRSAAAAIATGHIRRVHVARVNGHLFLNNASFGLYRKLLEERERNKQRFGRYKFVAVLSAVATVWKFRQVYTLRLKLDGEPRVLHTPLLFVGLNSLQLEKLDLDVAACTHAGQMAVIALRPTSRWHLLRLALKGALQGLHDSPELRCHGASEVLVEQAGRRTTRVAVDGESIECSLPLRFEVQRDALQVVVPHMPRGAQVSASVLMRIVHLSDPHFGTVVPAVRDALLGELQTHPPDLVLLTGDITQRARRSQFQEARAFMDALPGVPRLSLPGNHDLPLFDVFTRMVKPYDRYRHYICDDLEPEFIDGRVAVVCVDATSRLRHKDGALSEIQIERTARRLARLDLPFRVVATHQPLAAVVNTDVRNLARGAAHALDRWIAAGADLFLGGHIHLPYCVEVCTADRRQSGVLLQAGTCLSRRIRSGIPNSYNVVTLQRYGTERRMSIERETDAAAGRFVMGMQHEAASLMDRQRTRLNGWRLASRGAP